MKRSDKWAFKARFRPHAYGWRGTGLASQRLKEAVSEIKTVAKSDCVLAGEGVVSLMERLWRLPWSTSIRPRAPSAAPSTARSAT